MALEQDAISKPIKPSHDGSVTCQPRFDLAVSCALEPVPRLLYFADAPCRTIFHIAKA
jgi:hypothetical protein